MILNLTIKKCIVLSLNKQPVAMAVDKEREGCLSDQRKSDGSEGSGGLI